MGAKPQLIVTDMSGHHAQNLPETISRLQRGGSWKKQRCIVILPTADMISVTVMMSLWNLAFPPNDGVILVGTSVFSSSAIQFVNTSQAHAVGAAWWGAPVNIESGFSTTFQLQFTSAQANGLAFVIQNQGTATPLFNSSTGGSCVSGGPFTFANSDNALGYGYSPGGTGTGTTCGIGTSIAIAFDLYDVANSIGYYTNGALPEGNQTPITGGLNLASGHPINVTISYSGTTLTAALTDTVNSDTFSTNWTGVNIPSIVGANTAYIGFTAATGGEYANMFLNNWTAN